MTKNRKNLKWTKEAVLAEIERLGITKASELKKLNKAASNAAYRYEFIKELGLTFGGAKPIKWTEETVRQEALKYETKNSFQNNNSAAYNVARRLNLLEDLGFSCGYTKWTEDAAREELERLGVKTKKELREVNEGLTQVLLKKFPELYEEFFYAESCFPKKYWTEETIRKHAAECETNYEFSRKYRGGYSACLSKFPGLIDDLGFEKQVRESTQLYLTALETPAGKLLKVGISYDAFERAKKYGNKVEGIVLEVVDFPDGKSAYEAEQHLHSQLMAYNVSSATAKDYYKVADGYTECYYNNTRVIEVWNEYIR